MSGVEVEHSTDGGNSWKRITVKPHSVVAGLRPGETWDDGCGNTYRGVER